MLYADDRNAFVEVNWLTPRRVRALTVTGTRGVNQRRVYDAADHD